MIKEFKKHIITFILLLTSVLFGDFTFNDIPIQESGRIKPLDTYARNQLLRFSGKTSFKYIEFNKDSNLQEVKLSAIDFFIKILDGDFAYNAKVLYINNPEIEKSLVVGDNEIEEKHLYSINDLSKGYQHYYEYTLPKMLDETAYTNEIDYKIKEIIANIEHLILLHESLLIFKPNININSDYINSILNNLDNNPISIVEFVVAQDNIISSIMNESGDDKYKLELTLELLSIREQCRTKLRFFEFGDRSETNLEHYNLLLNIIPSYEEGQSWNSPYVIVVKNLLHEPYDTDNYFGLKNEEARLLALFNDFLKSLEKQEFNLKEYRSIISQYNIDTNKLILERNYNNINIFLYALLGYLVGLLFIFISWIFNSFNKIRYKTIFVQIAFWVSSFAFFLHASGIILRMIIMSRPPVSTLYESIIFVGFIIILVSMIFEYFRKDTLSLFLGLVGAIILHFIAFKYANDGDTLGVLVAVLNSNFWLSIHVTTITFGYGVSLVAGLMAHAYLLQAAINPKNENRLNIIFKNLYILTFIALFFTLLGTILGGIWADQSWGRFWGWDPKENGALLIVMWHLLVLHLRISGLVKSLGYAFVMSFVNIIVAIAWFGVNLLSVGLHSYGFTDSIATNLLIFIIIEFLFCIITFSFAKVHIINNKKS